MVVSGTQAWKRLEGPGLWYTVHWQAQWNSAETRPQDWMRQDSGPDMLAEVQARVPGQMVDGCGEGQQRSGLSGHYWALGLRIQCQAMKEPSRSLGAGRSEADQRHSQTWSGHGLETGSVGVRVLLPHTC